MTVTVPSGADVTVNPSPLTFTTDNWDTPQTVTVSSSADTDSDDDEVTLSHTVSGGGYQGVTADDVTVNVTKSRAKRSTRAPYAPRWPDLSGPVAGADPCVPRWR